MDDDRECRDFDPEWGFWLFLICCLVLTAGTPDLLDAITQRVMGCKP